MPAIVVRRARPGRAGARRTVARRTVDFARERTEATGRSRPALPAALGGRRPAPRRPGRAPAPDRRRGRASCSSTSTSRSRRSRSTSGSSPRCRTLSERDVLRFTHVDHRDRVAFVLTVANRMIAVGRFDRIPPRSRATRPGGSSRRRSRSSSRTPTRAAASPSCCSSTSPRPAASAASTGSSPTCCPRTARWSQIFREAGYHGRRRVTRTA